MTLPLAEEALDLAGKATRGPWCVGHMSLDMLRSGNWPKAPVHVGTFENRGNVLATVNMGGDGAISSYPGPIEDNAKFIAHAGTHYASLAQWGIDMARENERLIVLLAEKIADSRDCGAEVSEGGAPPRTVLCCNPHLRIDRYDERDCKCLTEARALLSSSSEGA